MADAVALFTLPGLGLFSSFRMWFLSSVSWGVLLHNILLNMVGDELAPSDGMWDEAMGVVVYLTLRVQPFADPEGCRLRVWREYRPQLSHALESSARQHLTNDGHNCAGNRQPQESEGPAHPPGLLAEVLRVVDVPRPEYGHHRCHGCANHSDGCED